MITLETLTYSLLSGILPAFVWLLFWLREDYKNPEPRTLLLKTFLLGMLAVVLVLPFQKIVDYYIPGTTLLAILLWVILEEVFKFSAAYLGGLRSSEDNEPIDPVVYMITAALGFVALENTLFISEPIFGQDLIRTVITGNLRFIGASLLHVVTSGMIGVALAFTFYKPKKEHIPLILLALCSAIILHAAFNLFIIYGGDFGAFGAMVLVWIAVISLLAIFEKVKTIAR